MTKYIFWTQSESNKEPDTLIIDGNVYRDRSLPSEIQKEFDLVTDYKEKKGLKAELFDRYHKRYNLSPNFIIYKKDNEFYLQSAFEDKDVEGRKITFLFFAKEQKYEEIYKIIADCAAKAKRTLRKNELSCYRPIIDDIRRRKLFKRVVKTIAGVVAVAGTGVGVGALFKKCINSHSAYFYGDKSIYEQLGKILVTNQEPCFYETGANLELGDNDSVWFVFDSKKYLSADTYSSTINGYLVSWIQLLGNNRACKLNIIAVSESKLDNNVIKECMLSKIIDSNCSKIIKNRTQTLNTLDPEDVEYIKRMAYE